MTAERGEWQTMVELPLQKGCQHGKIRETPRLMAVKPDTAGHLEKNSSKVTPPLEEGVKGKRIGEVGLTINRRPEGPCTSIKGSRITPAQREDQLPGIL